MKIVLVVALGTATIFFGLQTADALPMCPAPATCSAARDYCDRLGGKRCQELFQECRKTGIWNGKTYHCQVQSRD